MITTRLLLALNPWGPSLNRETAASALIAVARRGLAVDSLQKQPERRKKYRQCTRLAVLRRYHTPAIAERLLRGLGARSGIRQHSERALVEVEQALLLVVLFLVHFADLDELAHDFRLEAGAFGLGVDFLDVFAERALFVLEPLDAFDQ